MSNSEPFSRYPSTHRNVDLVISELLTDSAALTVAERGILSRLSVAERTACEKHQKRSTLNKSNTEKQPE